GRGRGESGTSLNPLDAGNRIGHAQRCDDRVKVREVVHLDVEVERLETAVAVDELQVDDVGVLGAEDARHRSEGSRGVAQDPREAARAAIRTLTPGEVEPVGVNPAGK